MDGSKMTGMKRIIIAIFIAFATASCTGCLDPSMTDEIPVTFTNTAGEWELVMWRGSDVEFGTVNVTLKDKEFVLRQSVGSMYPVEYTGSYNLIEEEGVGTIIRGLYDYTYEYWEHKYIVTSLTSSSMEWTSMDDPGDIYLYYKVIK